MPANTTITFNSYSLSDIVSFIPEMTDHQSAPERRMNAYPLARQNGSKLVSQFYADKHITLVGHIQAASQSALESKIDEVKAALSIPSKNLDITWAGSTRRYVATLEGFSIVRDPDMRDWCAFTVKFYVPTGVGLALTPTVQSVDGITAGVYSNTITIAGSAPAKPVMAIEIVSETDLASLSIEVTNSYGNTTIITVVRDFAAGEILTLNYATFEVDVDGTLVDYTGSWAVWTPGSTSYDITATSTAHEYDLDITYTPAYL